MRELTGSMPDEGADACLVAEGRSWHDEWVRVAAWRAEAFRRLGAGDALALQLVDADGADGWPLSPRDVEALTRRGCPLALALEILL